MLSVLAVSLFLSGCAKEKTIGMKQNIHHDDFEYSVQAVESTGQIGDKKASGRFYIVTFQVENRAKRVGHAWSNDIAYCVDANAGQYENDNEAQKELERIKPFGYQDSYHTAAGDDQTTRLVFDFPNEVKEPCLMVRGEFLMGDLLDGNQYKKTKIRLF
jgi:hypothetical protein